MLATLASPVQRERHTTTLDTLIIKAAGIQNGAKQQYKDSLAVSVMLRNRN
jgi:hypothetical protein